LTAAVADAVRAEAWWKSGVLYQIYPLSFGDSNGDGFGDLAGIAMHLDHLEWLGVDGIWLSPITVSPNADWGYDVADYVAVQPDIGTLADLDRLVAASDTRGIRVLLDFVPNHSSDQHPWFVESRTSRTAPKRDWYIWADPKPDGSPPNNWISSFGGPAWKLDPTTGQYYMFNHLSSQPDLNWWNEDVRATFDDIVRFWFDRGIAGFRIDVCNLIMKDAELRDNPPATAADDLGAAAIGQRTVYNGNRPEVHDVIRHWREIAESYATPRVLIGETPVDDSDALARFYGADDQLNLAFNFPFITAAFAAEPLRRIVEETEALLPPGAWPAWTGSNHDMSRLASRWAGDDPAKIRAALVMLLTLRGTPVLYQGDEIGLGDVPVAKEQLRDPLGARYWPHYAGRDPMRTPMHWNDGAGGGFSGPGVRPWLPLGDTAARNVQTQRDDPASILTLTHDLIALRRRTHDLHSGSYTTLPAPGGCWVWRRGTTVVVVVNLADSPTALTGVAGRVLVGTDRGRDGETTSGSVALRGWEALVIES
jgi:alpha-glucosidase